MRYNKYKKLVCFIFGHNDYIEDLVAKHHIRDVFELYTLTGFKCRRCGVDLRNAND